MFEKDDQKRYANRLSHLLNMGKPVGIAERPMDQNEQGFSGADLVRLEVVFSDGSPGSFICKKTDRRERMVMQLLTEQGHVHTPAAYSEDGALDEPAWMILQDLGKRVPAPHGDLQWIENVAGALAEIHGNNMGRGRKMPWLPLAGVDYWKKVVTQLSVDHFEKMVDEDPCFAQRFGVYLPKLREAGGVFVRDMTALLEETQWLTLTHGDLQGIDGDHVYNIAGKPYIIDFGFARYAPFYIDLVDYFSVEDSVLYYKALVNREFHLSLTDFVDRFRAVYRYPGFIYMFPSIMQWKHGSEERLLKLLQRIFS